MRTGNSESENDCTDSENLDDDEGDEEEEEEDEESERSDDVNEHRNGRGDYVRSSDKNVDEFLLQAKGEARAKQLRAKFERWETREIAREQLNGGGVGGGGGEGGVGVGGGGVGDEATMADGDDQSQVETAKA